MLQFLSSNSDRIERHVARKFVHVPDLQALWAFCDRHVALLVMIVTWVLFAELSAVDNYDSCDDELQFSGLWTTLGTLGCRGPLALAALR